MNKRHEELIRAYKNDSHGNQREPFVLLATLAADLIEVLDQRLSGIETSLDNIEKRIDDKD